MKKFETKFIVINLDHLENVPETKKFHFLRALFDIEEYLPDNKYYVCNQDEPYAQEVLDIILR